MADPVDDEKRNRILDAALGKFSAYGLARTSMADIAAGAGMSRPALYQHFSSKDDIFGAMLERIFAEAATNAIAALDRPGTLSEQLDGFLQRWYGDLTEQLYDTQHGDDIVQAKAGHAKPVVDAVTARIRRALADRIGRAFGASRARTDVTDLVDLMLLSPIGFKYDNPSVPKLRRRLTTVARAVAVTAGSTDRFDQPPINRR